MLPISQEYSKNVCQQVDADPREDGQTGNPSSSGGRSAPSPTPTSRNPASPLTGSAEVSCLAIPRMNLESCSQ